MAAGAVKLNYNLMVLESTAPKIFKVWAHIIAKKKNKLFWTRAFKYYLLIAFTFGAPLLITLDAVFLRFFYPTPHPGKKSTFFKFKLTKSMSATEVYINDTAAYFPNDPVSNEDMEQYLGFINGRPSKSKNIVLRNNAIKNRYYALEKGGKSTHTNAQMTALAIRELFRNDPEQIKELELLSCGTSSPDQMMPSHGVMTHGWLPEAEAIEVVSPSGVCCAGMHALKYAYLSIKCGEAKKAVATGSERFSGLLVSDVFEEEAQNLKELNENPFIAFQKDFLRWMLSDGASAFLMSDKPNETGISLRMEWIEGVSYANEMETCMYMGGEKSPDGTFKGFMDFTPEEIMEKIDIQR